MGFSHYWKTEKSFSRKQWTELSALAKKIFAATMIPIQFESDISDPPIIDNDGIRFNGVDDDGHETFLLDRRIRSFDFCKTARKPYDDVVIAVLIAASRVGNPGFSWSSDGDDEPGIFYAGKVLLEKAYGAMLSTF